MRFRLRIRFYLLIQLSMTPSKSESVRGMSTVRAALASIAVMLATPGCKSGNDIDTHSTSVTAATMAATPDCTERDMTGQFSPISIAAPEVLRYRDGSSKAVDLPNETDGETLTVYYRTNSDTLQSPDLADIAAFREQHRGATSWVLEGFADSRGTEEANVELAGKRVAGVEGRLTLKGISSSSITTVSNGEMMAEGRTVAEMAPDRRVTLRPQYFSCPQELTPEARVIVEGLEEMMPIEHLLMDLSGSMREELPVVRGFDTKDAEISGFNSCAGVADLDDLQQAEVCGETPLWSSILEVLNAENIDGLTVVTDGKNNRGTATASQVIALAKKKGVKIDIVAADVAYNDADKAELRSVANQTGGKYFIRN